METTGVYQIQEAMRMAKERLDLVEISPNATPPVCRITDYGKYAYEQKKLRKEQEEYHHDQDQGDPAPAEHRSA